MQFADASEIYGRKFTCSSSPTPNSNGLPIIFSVTCESYTFRAPYFIYFTLKCLKLKWKT